MFLTAIEVMTNNIVMQRVNMLLQNAFTELLKKNKT